jgi:2-methylcitrate dehydratase PrpD
MTDTTAPRLTEAVARYALSHAGPMSDEVVELAKRTLVDTVGVAIAARHEPPVRILGETLGALPPGPATVWATGEKTNAATAALLNGTAGHALDFDDVTDITYGHPSVVLWPAVFAAAENEGSDGRSVLEAFVVGFVVQVAMASAMDVRRHYAAGWHSTATIGIIGATAAVSRLMGLNEERTRCAIGLAASMAGGSRQNFGTMTKPLHPGLAARDAIVAARLAVNGFTADTDQLDAHLGYLSMFSPGADVDAALARLHGTDAFLEAGINVKKYPCCYNTHRTADATLDVRAAEGIDPATVESVHVVLEPGGFDPLIHHRPQTGLQGKFSIEYVITTALLDGRVTLASFTDEAVRRTEAQALIEKVTWATAEVPPVGEAAWDQAFSVVTVRSTDGREATFRTDVPQGDRRSPLSQKDLQTKFADCCSFSGSGWDAVALLAELWSIDGVDRLTSLKSLGDPSAR